jgi:hypothetical protein
MNSRRFLEIIHDAFVPFLLDLGFSLSEVDTSGRLYDVMFTSPNHAVSISYEPGDSSLLLIVHTIRNGQVSKIDDRNNTPRLTDLNTRYMKSVTPAELRAAKAAIENVAVDEIERKLLKAASELRLVLPKYLADHGGS